MVTGTGESESADSAGRDINWLYYFGKNLMASCKIRLRVTIWPSSSTLEDYCVRLFLARHNINIYLPQIQTDTDQNNDYTHWQTYMSMGVAYRSVVEGLLTGVGWLTGNCIMKKPTAPWWLTRLQPWSSLCDFQTVSLVTESTPVTVLARVSSVCRMLLCL